MWIDNSFLSLIFNILSTGSYYIGEFKDGHMDGEGVMTYFNGEEKSGEWKNGSFVI